MMSNAVILEKVASREITPQYGAQLMLEADAEARAKRRPRWAPPWLWAVGGALAVLILAIVGVPRD
jgi:hypothetical protein